MARPVVFTNRNENVLVDIEWSGETLRKDIHNVVVTVRAVIELDAKRVLPFLRLQDMVRIRGMKNEPFEIEFAHTTQFRPRLESHIGVIADAVVAFEKSDLGIEIGSDLAMLSETFEPAVLIDEAGAKISLSRRNPR